MGIATREASGSTHLGRETEGGEESVVQDCFDISHNLCCVSNTCPVRYGIGQNQTSGRHFCFQIIDFFTSLSYY
jgi:hypothetical protein